MNKSTGDNTKTRRQRSAQTGELVGTRFQPDLLGAIDAWRGAQPDLPSRPEAIRRLTALALGNE